MTDDNNNLTFTNAATPTVAETWTFSDAGNNRLFITSSRGKQLTDLAGIVALSDDLSDRQKWSLSNAGGGRYILRSNRGKHLSDFNGIIGLSDDSLAAQEWLISTTDGSEPCVEFGAIPTTVPIEPEECPVQTVCPGRVEIDGRPISLNNVRYSLGEFGQADCPPGKQKVESAEACYAAAGNRAFGIHAWVGAAGSWEQYPSGCYYLPSEEEVFMNTSQTGGGNSAAQAICMNAA